MEIVLLLEIVFQYFLFLTKTVILLSKENKVNPLMHNDH